MIDVTTNEPLRVSAGGKYGPYLELPDSQVDTLRQLLDRHGIYYWVDETIFSFDNSPFMAYVRFGPKGDARAIQALLDGNRWPGGAP